MFVAGFVSFYLVSGSARFAWVWAVLGRSIF